MLGSVAKKLIQRMFKTTNAQMIERDLDESVKEASITTMSLLVARFSSTLSSSVAGVLSVLQERLGNDVTRVPALVSKRCLSGETTFRCLMMCFHCSQDGLTRIADSKDGVSLQSVVKGPSFLEIASFLRKVADMPGALL